MHLHGLPKYHAHKGILPRQLQQSQLTRAQSRLFLSASPKGVELASKAACAVSELLLGLVVCAAVNNALRMCFLSAIWA